MVQIDLNTSSDTSELDDDVFDDDPCYKYNDEALLRLDNLIYKSVNLDDHHHPSRSKSELEKLDKNQYLQRSNPSSDSLKFLIFLKL